MMPCSLGGQCSWGGEVHAWCYLCVGMGKVCNMSGLVDCLRRAELCNFCLQNYGDLQLRLCLSMVAPETSKVMRQSRSCHLYLVVEALPNLDVSGPYGMAQHDAGLPMHHAWFVSHTNCSVVTADQWSHLINDMALHMSSCTNCIFSPSHCQLGDQHPFFNMASMDTPVPASRLCY